MADDFLDSDILAMPAAQYPGEEAIPEWQPANPQTTERETSWDQQSQPTKEKDAHVSLV